MTLEVDGATKEESPSTRSEFTENASLKQVLCLLPNDQDVGGDESSDDSVQDSKTMKKGNLRASKGLSAFIRVSKQATEIGAKPKKASIIR